MYGWGGEGVRVVVCAALCEGGGMRIWKWVCGCECAGVGVRVCKSGYNGCDDMCVCSLCILDIM